MTKSIDNIASKHLGRDASGNIMASYITPKCVDNTLLVDVPRILNRTQYNIEEDNLPFIGFDVWNGYEFSTLTDSGYPISGVIKIKYPANSKNIVESKSLKLYLNSFNMEQMGRNVSEVIANSKQRIEHDLGVLLESDVECAIIPTNVSNTINENLMFEFDQLDDHVESDVGINVYYESEQSLKSSETGTRTFGVRSDALRSNCRVTNQPDWGDVFIAYDGDHNVDLTSLQEYIISLRNENHFHEEICEMIYKRIYDKFNPRLLLVACLYTRRGGIDINPIRANSEELYEFCPNILNVNELSQKTFRQ